PPATYRVRNFEHVEIAETVLQQAQDENPTVVITDAKRRRHPAIKRLAFKKVGLIFSARDEEIDSVAEAWPSAVTISSTDKIADLTQAIDYSLKHASVAEEHSPDPQEAVIELKQLTISGRSCGLYIEANNRRRKYLRPQVFGLVRALAKHPNKLVPK